MPTTYLWQQRLLGNGSGKCIQNVELENFIKENSCNIDLLIQNMESCKENVKGMAVFAKRFIQNIPKEHRRGVALYLYRNFEDNRLINHVFELMIGWT